MTIRDPWLSALECQDAIVRSAQMDLEDARRANWRVLRAELAVDSVTAAYYRLISDAPRDAVVRHLRRRVESVHP